MAMLKTRWYITIYDICQVDCQISCQTKCRIEIECEIHAK